MKISNVKIFFLKEEVATIKSKLYRQSYSYENISQDPTLFKSETGLRKEILEELYTLYNQEENCVNIKLYESKSRKSVTFKKLQYPSQYLAYLNYILSHVSCVQKSFLLKQVHIFYHVLMLLA